MTTCERPMSISIEFVPGFPILLQFFGVEQDIALLKSVLALRASQSAPEPQLRPPLSCVLGLWSFFLDGAVFLGKKHSLGRCSYSTSKYSCHQQRTSKVPTPRMEPQQSTAYNPCSSPRIHKANTTADLSTTSYLQRTNFA